MSNIDRTKSKANTDKKLLSSPSLVVKQIITALLCLFVIIIMKHSGNTKLSRCTDALGKALRYDTNWREKVEETVSEIKRISLPETSDSPSNDTHSADFR